MIDKLFAELRRPDQVYENIELDLADFKAAIGVNLPQEYRMFVEYYGTGSLDEYILFLNPNSANNDLNLQLTEYFQLVYETFKDNFGDQFPRPIFPKKGGLFPWALTIDGDFLTWEVSDKRSDLWSVVIFYKSGDEQSFDLTFSEFMVALLTGELKNCNLPKSLLDEQNEFVAIRPD